MTSKIHPSGDPRPIDELVNIALSESDDKAAWHAVWQLKRQK